MRKTLVTILVLSAIFAADMAYAQTVRKNINNLSAQELQSLRRGVEVMKSRDSAARNSANWRRSWQFWANMHLHFGQNCNGPVLGHPSFAGQQDWTAQSVAETRTWCQCEHGTDHFIAWHRMYLWYFERVLSQAAGDPNLHLPYWDYSDPASRELPVAYRSPTYVDQNGQTKPNPLFTPHRHPGLNAGTVSLQASTVSLAQAFGEDDFLNNVSGGFSGVLEQTPHGAVHCSVTVGPSCSGTGLMGNVATAAQDPIFWLHHANIDRLLECWINDDPANHQLPGTKAFLSRKYTFVNETGARRVRAVRTMLTTPQLGYTYEKSKNCLNFVGSAMSTSGKPGRIVRGVATSFVVGEHVDLGAGSAQVVLKFGTTARNTVGARAAAVATRQRHLLVLEGITYTANPGGMYIVYLKSGNGDRVQVGQLSFFGVMEGKHKAHHGTGRQAFDITAALRQIAKDELIPEEVTLEIEPTTGLSDSTPEKAQAGHNRDAGLKVESVKFVIQERESAQ